MLLNNVKPQIAFTFTKVGTYFQIKDNTEMKHNQYWILATFAKMYLNAK